MGIANGSRRPAEREVRVARTGHSRDALERETRHRRPLQPSRIPQLPRSRRTTDTQPETGL